jgi:hypothetical protein
MDGDIHTSTNKRQTDDGCDYPNGKDNFGSPFTLPLEAGVKTKHISHGGSLLKL